MNGNNTGDEMIVIILKLIPLATLIIVGDFLILTPLGLYNAVPVFVLILLSLSPIICLIFFFCMNVIKRKVPKKEKIELPNYRYYTYFPFYYSFPVPKKNPNINVMNVCQKMEDCDIVLRRYKYLLDGLIFSENSYFTHAGIYYKKKKSSMSGYTDQEETSTDSHMVLHATMEKKVHESTLEEYCMCDDIVVLRFSLDDTIEDKNISEYINAETRKLDEFPELKKTELDLYTFLDKETKLTAGKHTENNPFEKWKEVVLGRAKSLLGTPYDQRFEFNNFDRVSCIEYVWFCYKSLFPFHRIRVKDFEFFNAIKMPVIVPDVFIKNDFFKYVWSNVYLGKNIHEEDKKRALKSFIKDRRSNFWRFILSYYVWTLLFLFLIIISFF